MNSIEHVSIPFDSKSFSLSANEISVLEQANCTADNWSLIAIDKESISKVHNTHFKGRVQINRLSDSYSLTPYVVGKSKIIIGKPCVQNATLENVLINNNCYVKNVNIKNTSVGKHSWLENIDNFSITAKPHFGVGTEIKLFSKLPKHGLKIFTALTAPTACLSVLADDLGLNFSCRNFLETIFLSHIKTEQKDAATFTTNIIGENCVIRNCGDLIDVSIGDDCTVSHCYLLVNGKIGAHALRANNLPATTLRKVTAENFIIKRGCSLKDDVLLHNVFIGDGVNVQKRASISNSVLFAGTNISHSELEGVFCAMGSSSHHQATLLIATYLSHFNAGSAANASNHLYGLGAYHYGVLKRGVKLASSATLIYPTQIGIFSTVLGNMHKQIDTTFLPFSLLIGKGRQVDILPGKNLVSVGLQRDLLKWQDRIPNIPLLKIPIHNEKVGKKNSTTKIITTTSHHHHSIHHPLVLERIYTAYFMLKKNIVPTNALQTQKKISWQKSLWYRFFIKQTIFGNLRLTKKNRHTGKRYYYNFLHRITVADGKKLSQLNDQQIKKLLPIISIIKKFYDKRKQSEMQFFNAEKSFLWIDCAGFFIFKPRLEKLLSKIEATKTHAYTTLCSALFDEQADDDVYQQAFTAYLCLVLFKAYPWHLTARQWNLLQKKAKKLQSLYLQNLKNQIDAERKLAFNAKIETNLEEILLSKGKD